MHFRSNSVFLSPLLLLIAAYPALGQREQAEVPAGRFPQRNPKFTVPAGTTLYLALRGPIYAKDVRVGQTIFVDTTEPVFDGNRTVIPAGSSLTGTVTQIIVAGQPKDKLLQIHTTSEGAANNNPPQTNVGGVATAQIALEVPRKVRPQIRIRFDSLSLPNGTKRPLSAAFSSFGSADYRTVDREWAMETLWTPIPVCPDQKKSSEKKSKGRDVIRDCEKSSTMSYKGEEYVIPPGTSMEAQLARPVVFDEDEIAPRTPYDEGPALPPANRQTTDH